MNNAVAERPAQPPHLTTAIEQALVGGDLSKLSPDQRVTYYRETCRSLGLNPLTRPFDYLTLNGKLTLYARKDCTDQLRKLNGVSIGKPDIQQVDDLIIVAVTARDKDGREDSDLGVVKKSDMRGDLANAMMKAITKAKRRVTLSICGLGMLDETEVETIPDARTVPVEAAHRPAPAVENGPANGEAQAALPMLRTELGSLIRQVAELRKLEPDYVFQKLLAGVRLKFPQAPDTTSLWDRPALLYGLTLAQNSFKSAQQPPRDREPGDDDEPADSDHDHGDPVGGEQRSDPPKAAATSAASTPARASAANPSSAPGTPSTPATTSRPTIPESRLSKELADPMWEAMRQVNVTWRDVIRDSLKMIGRQLPPNSGLTDLSLSESTKVIEWCKRVKADREKAKRDEEMVPA